MVKSRLGGRVRSNTLPLIGAILSSLLFSSIANAQIVPDETLGTQAIPFTPGACGGTGGDCGITDGTTRGNNLFHSFRQFSLPNGDAAGFITDPAIHNVIVRVTGVGQPFISNINGAILTLDNALNPVSRNFFLLNPNGIIFGPNAQILVGGSFLASTANRMLFQDGTVFDTRDQTVAPLLTVSVPIGLQVGQSSGDIRMNESQLLAGLPGDLTDDFTDFTLVGGNISLDKTRLSTLGSAIDFQGNDVVFNDSRIASITLGSLPGKDVTVKANKFGLQNGSFVLVSTLGQGNAGNVEVLASEVELTGISANGVPSALRATSEREARGNGGNLDITTGRLLVRDGGEISTVTFSQGQGGALTINASEFIEVMGTSSDQTFVSIIASQTQGIGNAGDLNITTKRLAIRDGAIVSTDAFRSTGNGGNINVFASESVEIAGTSIDSNLATGGKLGSETRSSGQAGNITIQTQDLTLRGQVGISADTTGAGRGGNIDIFASKVSVLGGAMITASTAGRGRGGNITIHSADVEVVGTGIAQSLITTQAGGFLMIAPGTSIGNSQAGNLTIWAERLSVREGGRVRTSTFGSGQAGNLIINASESVFLSGSGLTNEGLLSSGLFSDTLANATGSSGNLTINTSRLFLQEGAQVGVGSFGRGTGGTLTINASELIDLSGFSAEGTPSGLFASTEGSGAAGSIRLTTKHLNVRDFARVNVSSEGTGAVGNLEVTADSILLDNYGWLIASTLAGDGGNILLNVKDFLFLRNGSLISTSAGTAEAGGNGGNIIINSPKGFIVGVKSENSDITADAFTGSGGRVSITAQGIYGLEFRPNLTPFSDITASSTFGASGIVTLNTPGVDPSRGLTQLPQSLIDTNRILANSCIVRDKASGGIFLITGTGGLPIRPGDPPLPAFPTGDVQGVQKATSHEPRATSRSTSKIEHNAPIVEAQGIYQLPDGQLILSWECPR